MTDAELASYLNLTPAEAARLIPKMSPKLRATFDRMKQVETEASLWVKGEGPKPQGVLIDLPRPQRQTRC